MRRASIDTSLDPTYGLVRASQAGEIARGGASCSSLTCHFLPSVVCCALVCSLGTLECWGGRQGGCGLELCVRQLRVCGSQLAVCLVSLFVSVCRSCVSSSSVQRPPIPRWCPVRAWLFFTFLPTYLPNTNPLVPCERSSVAVAHTHTPRRTARPPAAPPRRERDEEMGQRRRSPTRMGG